jgi:O-antigen/teichoic acid export membrane protein
MSSTRKVARNAFWVGIESAATLLISLFVAVLVARYFGPQKLGYYNYLLWMTMIAGTIGNMGLSGTCRKYMAEYLGREQKGLALSVFWFSFRVQSLVVVAIMGAGVALALGLAPAGYKTIGVLLVLSIGPRILGFIPSSANMAAEENAANVPGALAGSVVQMAGTILSMICDWGLLGLAASVVAGYTVELTLKSASVVHRFRGVDSFPLDRSATRRLIVFSGQGLMLMTLSLVVWDRTDLVLLERLQPDAAQLTFFSLSFSLIDKLLICTSVFSIAAVSRVMAQYGEDKTRVPALAGLSGSYMLLMATPLLLGAAALSPAAIPFVYGEAYRPAVAVFLVMASLAIPKVLLQSGQSVLQAHERQRFLVIWSLICGALNLALDVVLIPGQGAVGAAIANGLAQSLSALGVWLAVTRWYGVRLRTRMLTMNLVASLGMAAAATAALAWQGPLGLRLLAGTSAGAAVYLLLVRWTRALEDEDRQRLLALEGMLPAVVRPPYRRLVDAVAVAA